MQSTLTLLKDWGIRRSLTRDAVLVVLGSLLLTLSAKVQVPFWPVPMTMQTFVVLMIGLHFGPRLAGLSVLAYLFEGVAGLPVFSTGAGLAFLAYEIEIAWCVAADVLHCDMLRYMAIHKGRDNTVSASHISI